MGASNSYQELLGERLDGETYTAIGERHGLTHAGVRYGCAKAIREHALELLPHVWRGQLTDEPVVFAVPGWVAENDQIVALRYLMWLLEEFDALGNPLEISMFTGSDGTTAYELRDPFFTSRPRPRGSADFTPSEPGGLSA